MNHSCSIETNRQAKAGFFIAFMTFYNIFIDLYDFYGKLKSERRKAGAHRLAKVKR